MPKIFKFSIINNKSKIKMIEQPNCNRTNNNQKINISMNKKANNLKMN